ncbi:bifunctional hydroxymethylpyrimidine kinase/phosphomethylpyrimidine kinase [Pseudooceanicola algae]|uniref:hydroxymethylpyrimidine kinase n=1 Tax=Pseudooceanicola algae TaxID=1537215 RepID=A0A418SHB1_9RHOB|nr:hydroxymethylpyrimidine/phosphomethylpyrimidine kinase [Pseudooceanicola algae]QPM90438.1 Hydroxymethylpyrimidine/phosphomethylpyrimidine kinase [Pseudooceanicola algae]
MSPAVLFIGGMDSSGGAGLMRDCATAQALGATARSAVTAVTAQSDRAVSALHPVPEDIVAAQIAAAADTGADPVAAIKVGMLGSAGITRAVARTLARHLPDVPLVLDPVLCASSGRALIDAEGIAAMLPLLVPRATLLTPNLPELRALCAPLGLPGETGEAEICAALLDLGCGAVLVKGGHAPQGPTSEDRLYQRGYDLHRLSSARYPVALRGTGCQLASAVAVHLAGGRALPAAVAKAKEMLDQRFRAAATRGDGDPCAPQVAVPSRAATASSPAG